MAKVADGGKCEPVRQEDEIDYVEWVDMEEAKRRVTEWYVGVLEVKAVELLRDNSAVV